MRKHLNSRTNIAQGLVFAFLLNTFSICPIQAQEFYLPAPGQMMAVSPAFNPVVLKGIKLDPQNPFRFHFFVDTGDESSLGVKRPNTLVIASSQQERLKIESSKLIKYFLASLTIPENDLWVNLSPYEKDRIIPQEFGQTEMGRDLLAEDYILKQITASLIYPESKLGKEFWAKVYAQAQAKYGTTNIPINTFNKVWIIPDKAVVYENGGTAFVLENHLKVMLDQDYLSLLKHRSLRNDMSSVGANIIREIVIPALTKEVNEGKNFSQLRQVFYSLILATWYKKKIKDSILNKVYSDRKKTQGLAIHNNVEDIYQLYLKAFKKGVYNYIKEDSNPITGQTIPRKYFSGGVVGKETLEIKHRNNVPLRDFSQFSSIEEIDGDMSMIGQTIRTGTAIAPIDLQVEAELLKRRLVLLASYKSLTRWGTAKLIYSAKAGTESLVASELVTNYMDPAGAVEAAIEYRHDQQSNPLLTKPFSFDTARRNARFASLWALRNLYRKKEVQDVLIARIDQEAQEWSQRYGDTPDIIHGMPWERHLIVRTQLGHEAGVKEIDPGLSLLENLRLDILAKRMNLSGEIQIPYFLDWAPWVYRSIRYVFREEELSPLARRILYAQDDLSVPGRGGSSMPLITAPGDFHPTGKPIIMFFSSETSLERNKLAQMAIRLDAPSGYDLVLGDRVRITSLESAKHAFNIAISSSHLRCVVTNSAEFRDFVAAQNFPDISVIFYSPNDHPAKLMGELNAFYLKDRAMNGEVEHIKEINHQLLNLLIHVQIDFDSLKKYPVLEEARRMWEGKAATLRDAFLYFKTHATRIDDYKLKIRLLDIRVKHVLESLDKIDNSETIREDPVFHRLHETVEHLSNDFLPRVLAEGQLISSHVQRSNQYLLVIVNRAIELAGNKPGITVTTVFDAGNIGQKVPVDAFSIGVAVIDLITNAQEAIESAVSAGSQKEPGKIVVEIRYEDNMAKIIVRDNGPGIPAGNLLKIRERYFTTKGSNGGTGLGLAIIDEIVEAHHGYLSVESKEGQGATFTINLPDTAMHAQALMDNIAMRNLAHRNNTSKFVDQWIKEFLNPDHPLKEEIFEKIDRQFNSDEKIIGEINRVLKIPRKSNGWFHVQGPVSIRELFLHTTMGESQDIPQALSNISFVNNGENIDERMGIMGREALSLEIEHLYLLIKAIEILSRAPDLFYQEDAKKGSSLSLYLTSRAFIKEDGGLARYSSDDFFGLSELLTSQLLGRDITGQENTITDDQLKEAMALPENQKNNESIRNFLSLLDLLKETSHPWAAKLEEEPDLIKRLRRDFALSVKTSGGIDLNPAQMSMQIKREGEDFKYNFNGTQIDAALVTGVQFTIRQMRPVTNLPQVLGLN